MPAEGWVVEHHSRVTTTQALARGRPAWSAVWADVQTAGRGQAERSFVSAAGGLYLTAVLPYDGDAMRSRGFALAVGRSVWLALRALGVQDLRLRWPNDLMVGPLKVGGILVEQGGPETLLVGLGLNLRNRPWTDDPSLNGIAGRLVDAWGAQPLPESGTIMTRLLGGIREAHEEFTQLRLSGLAAKLTPCWGASREVELEPAAGVRLPVAKGWFQGIDGEGDVRLRISSDTEVAIPAHHIRRLLEVGGTV